jgi:hypothetical protein
MSWHGGGEPSALEPCEEKINEEIAFERSK